MFILFLCTTCLFFCWGYDGIYQYIFLTYTVYIWHTAVCTYFETDRNSPLLYKFLPLFLVNLSGTLSISLSLDFLLSFFFTSVFVNFAGVWRGSIQGWMPLTSNWIFKRLANFIIIFPANSTFFRNSTC